MIDVGNNRHVTNVFDFVHLTTHVVDGKLLRRRGRVGQFRRGFRRPAYIFSGNPNLCVIGGEKKKNVHEQHVDAPRCERPERPRELESNPTLTMVEDFFWFRLNYWTRVLVCAPSSNWREFFLFRWRWWCLFPFERWIILDFFVSFAQKYATTKRVTINNKNEHVLYEHMCK